MLPSLLKTVKTTVKRFNPIAQQAKNLYYCLPPELRQSLGVDDSRTETELSLKPYIRPEPDFFFIKIGANDGMMGDPFGHWIRQYNWSGIMVEPVSYLFEQLVINYRNCSNLKFENAAIAECDGHKTFYSIRKPEVGEVLPEWCQGISSFRRDVFMRHQSGFSNLENFLCEVSIPCLTFSQLLSKYHVQHIDLLHIDTEGYDYEILKTLDLSVIKPTLILYEVKHLSSSDQHACDELLSQHGYQIQSLGVDALAVLAG